MFDYLFQLQKELKEYETLQKIGFKTIQKNNMIIFVNDKIKILKDNIQNEELRIKQLYF